MTRMTRRQFLRASGTGVGVLTVAGLEGCATSTGEINPKAGRRVVVVGGGWGGATAARYVRAADPSIEVVMLEPNKTFVSCPFSNLVLTVPPIAYRCPPGPYERICQVAWYLKTNKPKSKLIVLDANQNIVSKAALFRAAWQAYPNIDYRASNKVVRVDPGGREVTTDFGDKVKYD